jgi:hypothetical protein
MYGLPSIWQNNLNLLSTKNQFVSYKFFILPPVCCSFDYAQQGSHNIQTPSPCYTPMPGHYHAGKPTLQANSLL